MKSFTYLAFTYLADAYLYPVLQFLLALFCVCAIIMERRTIRGRSQSGVRAGAIRGENSMGKFYAVYAGISGILVALALAVDCVDKYRTAAVTFNVLLSAYLCLLNRWFRNKLVGWVGSLSQRENV
jgi:hypothetical protein